MKYKRLLYKRNNLRTVKREEKRMKKVIFCMVLVTVLSGWGVFRGRIDAQIREFDRQMKEMKAEERIQNKEYKDHPQYGTMNA